MRAPLPCESMACLPFMHLSLPVGLSSFTMRFYYLFLTLYGVDEPGSSFFASRFFSGLGLS